MSIGVYEAKGASEGDTKTKKELKKRDCSHVTRSSCHKEVPDEMGPRQDGPPRESHVFNKRKSGGEGEGEAQ